MNLQTGVVERIYPEGHREGALSEHDKDNITTAGVLILKRLSSDFPDRLPDVVVLPGVSAMPLEDLLYPPLLWLVQQKDGHMPEIVHFPVAGRSYAIRETSSPDSRDELMRRGDFHLLEEADFIRRKWQKSASDIRDRLKGAGIPEPKIVIVDDYATQFANTIRELRKAFGQELPAYVFAVQDDKFLIDGLKVSAKSFGVTFGLTDNTQNIHGAIRFGGPFEYIENREAIGYGKKSDGEIFPLVTQDTDAMQALRDSMKQVGAEIVKLL